MDEILFEFNDGGSRIPKNYNIKTDSIEVIIDFLVKNGITNNKDYPGRNRYLTKRINIINEGQA